MTFGNLLMVIFIGYFCYYAGMITYDQYFKKDDVPLEATVEEEEIDISEEAKAFQPQNITKDKKNELSKEEQSEQKTVIVLSGLMFIASFIIAGLNFRFKWIVLPDWIVYVATALFLLGYILYAEVLRENAYLSRTVEVQENQKVIDTGLYGIVRHPMYMSTFVLFLSMPLVLGSVISFAIMLLYIPIIAKRIRNEEQVLEEGLVGYSDYKKRVKYKVIPFVW